MKYILLFFLVILITSINIENGILLSIRQNILTNYLLTSINSRLSEINNFEINKSTVLEIEPSKPVSISCISINFENFNANFGSSTVISHEIRQVLSAKLKIQLECSASWLNEEFGISVSSKLDVSSNTSINAFNFLLAFGNVEKPSRTVGCTFNFNEIKPENEVSIKGINLKNNLQVKNSISSFISQTIEVLLKETVGPQLLRDIKTSLEFNSEITNLTYKQHNLIENNNFFEDKRLNFVFLTTFTDSTKQPVIPVTYPIVVGLPDRDSIYLISIQTIEEIVSFTLRFNENRFLISENEFREPTVMSTEELDGIIDIKGFEKGQFAFLFIFKETSLVLQTSSNRISVELTGELKVLLKNREDKDWTEKLVIKNNSEFSFEVKVNGKEAITVMNYERTSNVVEIKEILNKYIRKIQKDINSKLVAYKLAIPAFKGITFEGTTFLESKIGIMFEYKGMKLQ